MERTNKNSERANKMLATKLSKIFPRLYIVYEWGAFTVGINGTSLFYKVINYQDTKMLAYLLSEKLSIYGKDNIQFTDNEKKFIKEVVA